MGAIGRTEDDLIIVVAEDEGYYIGTFCEGFGFIDVHFSKENVRPLTRMRLTVSTKSIIQLMEKRWGKIIMIMMDTGSVKADESRILTR